MISLVLRNICNKLDPIDKFKMYVCLDASIFLDEIEALIDKGLSVFVMIPMRLGLDSIQPNYLTQVKHLFEINQNVGIAGGKEHFALYLVGSEDVENSKAGLFYLDPHFI